MSLFQQKLEGVPQFVSYFAPVRQALLQMNGQALPREVCDFIAQQYAVSVEERAQVNSSGNSIFDTRVAWARFYLTKAGWMYSPKRGVWALTDLGKQSDLTEAGAPALFKSVHTTFKGHEEEKSAPDTDVLPDDAQFWFVGTTWHIEKLPEFKAKGIWVNGYTDKFTDLVLSMKPGDRIAAKSTLVRKYDLPFDNKGLSISGMRIKAVGTVTRNHGDGQTLDVEWDAEDSTTSGREWYFYTYRNTVTRARVEDEESARRLVNFAFKGAPQDYAYFLTHPYWQERFQRAANGDVPDNQSMLADDVEPSGVAAGEWAPDAVTYTVADILTEGCFLPESDLSSMLARWREKKNLILQGPPGTGKTWLAKRLAKALMGLKDAPHEQLRVVQFHPTLSYEDFVRGYRPGADGRLTLTDGVFLQVLESARAQPDLEHVLIIEEINRGNPAQVLGEMLTLLENSKRSGHDAMELAYRKFAGEKVYVPENLYVVGTMNIADRSLALVDLALRRRFAFVNLGPNLNEAWVRWCAARGLDTIASTRIQQAMHALNESIAADKALGPQFQIGHSFVTPAERERVHDPVKWFADVVHTEIGPLLHEYWFDNPGRAEQEIAQLLRTA